MVAINAHYDGKVIVPDEPLDLAPDQPVTVWVAPRNEGERPKGSSALAWLVANAGENADVPPDLSYQHDHYLYGTPKREA
jgi:hypothetical protein